METVVRLDLAQVARDLELPVTKVDRTVSLLDEGNTVPFITRYRRDQTGGLDEEQIRRIQERVSKLRLLAERKSTILKSIEAQGKLTPSLAAKIGAASSTKRLEDLYLPYKPKKQTLATLARQRGLEPLATEVFDGQISVEELAERASQFVRVDKELYSLDDVMQGVRHLLAERYSERADLRGRLRKILRGTGKLVSTAVVEDKTSLPPSSPPEAGAAPAPESSDADPPREPANWTEPDRVVESTDTIGRSKKDKKKRKTEGTFKDYADYCEPLNRIPPHRILAINRGERAKLLRVRIEADSAAIYDAAEKLLPEDHLHRDYLRSCLRDALSRLVLPALERELRRELTERAEQHAVEVFARNLRKLFLQPPVRHRRVLAVDPGFRSGCKLAALDEFGNILGHGVIHVVGSDDRRKTGRQQLIEMIQRHQLSVVAIGNGTACRETEQLVADVIGNELKEYRVEYVIVNEAGASVYSTSAIGREELPGYDATLRGAISIGRRLLDPLSELVKINAANIGVGLYQHDVKASHLRDSLDDVVASCVNYVGVDVNTASPALLRYVSGLNQLTARRLYEHRQQLGPFKNREQFKQVPGFGEATFVQSAGFLKIRGGDNPLDATWIHPESYEIATRVLAELGSSVDKLGQKSASRISPANGNEDALASPRTASTDSVHNVNVDRLSAQLGIGKLLLQDILTTIARPGRDPREDLPPPVFRREIVKFEDLKPGMELTGTVLNVVDFGAFVDIGLNDTGLVHISRLANRFISDPHDVVSVGDVLKVWVLDVDKQRRRVSLTALKPGTETPPGRRPPKGADRPSTEIGESSKPRHRQLAVTSTGRGAKKGKLPKSRNPRDTNRPKKPVTPITQAMVDGKEPMRSFSDLKQFFEKKKASPEEEQNQNE